MQSSSSQSAFAAAVLAIDEGRVEDLDALLAEQPELANARGRVRDKHYFSGSTLLHHVAWNPYPSHREFGLDTCDPTRMPERMPEVVTLLVDAGADPRDRNRGGSEPIGLLLTSRLASESGLLAPVLDALLDAGATVDVSPARLHTALANHAPAAARALLERGAGWDVRVAAGLGDLDRLRSLVGTQCPTLRELGLAALHAYVGNHRRVLGWLLAQEVDLSATGVGNGTLLHRACADGDLSLVARLTALGADHGNRDNPFRATPLDWADHAGQAATVHWIITRARDRLDLFQAAAHGLLDVAREILHRDPKAVIECRHVWRYRAVQALRIAVVRRHRNIAALLLEHGARPDHAGGDGLTALDEARRLGDGELVGLLARASGGAG